MTLPLPYEPDDAFSVAVAPGIEQVAFNSGYQHRATKGMRGDLQKWQVTFDKKHQDVGEMLYDFFDALGAVEAFSWTPPGEAVARLFVAPEYQKDFPVGGRVVQTITTTFEEVRA